jgi:hypothetical protein
MTQSLGDASWCAVRRVGWEPQAGGFLVSGSTRQPDRSDQHHADRTRFGTSGDDNRDSNSTVTEGDLHTVEGSPHELGVRTVVIPRKGRPSTARQAEEHRRAFRRTVRWRTGSEGRAIVLTGVADREPLAIRVTVGPYTVLVRWPNGDIDLIPRGVAHACRSCSRPTGSCAPSSAPTLTGCPEPGMLTGPSTGTPVCAWRGLGSTSRGWPASTTTP